jgi:inosine-uridine nucleoside N-ribohydrolase
MKKTLLLLLLAAATANVYSQNKPKPVIFDTDMGPDYDDVGAITLLHAFADSGKATILATMASNKYEGIAGVIDVFNTYFGRPNIPIGIPHSWAVNERDSQHWTDSILAHYPHRITRNDQAEDAVKLYRRILAAQPAQSVVIITTGFLTNLHNLLKSPADNYSPLDGSQLVKQKVKQLVAMAGKFPQGWEFNVMRDSIASADVFDNWPTPILLSGFAIGEKIKTGLPLVRNASIRHSPVKEVFRISLPQAPEDRFGRSSWDETAVLVALAGAQPWYTVEHGRIRVNPNGSDTWQASPNGPHARLIEALPPAQVQEVINNLMQHQPSRLPH